MGFKSVYRNLQEVFPQMENRLLRAVAIEHPKDADVAVGIVITEIIPRLDRQKVASSSSNSGGSSGRKAKFYSPSPVSFGISNEKDSDMHRIADANMHFGQQDIVGHSILDSNMAVSKASSPVKQCSDGNSLEIKNVIQKSLIPAEASTPDAETFAVKKPTEFKDESAPKPLVDGSGEIYRLEGFAEDAKIYKKTLFSALHLVTSLLKEIKIVEKEVEDARNRAARSVFDILRRLEDIDDIAQHAKKANEMMHCKLGEPLAEAEMVEKEKLAKNALTVRQLSLVKLIKESKKINPEAEEDTKSCKFPMDRRTVVDMVKEKISTISQKVKLLEEELKEASVPFGESVEPVQFLGKEVDIDFVRNEASDTLKESSRSNRIASAHKDSQATDDEWDLCDHP